MTVERIHDLSLSQVPDFDGAIVTGRDEELSWGVESDRVHFLFVSIVMLQKPLRSGIKNFDLLISSARGEAGAIWMESDALNHTCVIGERVHDFWISHIPELHSAIVRARSYHSGIERKLRASYPILMAFKSLNEFELLDIPDLDKLVVRGWN